jgi:hypothetical protein
MTNKEFYEAVVRVFDAEKYCRQFSVAQPKPRGKFRLGPGYIADLYKRSVSEGDPEKYRPERFKEILAEFEAFIQNERRGFLVFIPKASLKAFLISVFRRNPIFTKSAYKGVSYNPNLTLQGEKFDNLDFFSWAAYVQRLVPGFELVIYDASLYQAINMLGEIKFPGGDIARWFYDLLITTQQKEPKFAKNCSMRRQYLQAMLKATGIRGRYLDTEDIIRDNWPELEGSFKDALAACRAVPKKNKLLELGKFVSYRRYGTEFAKSYTPAVVAESLFFQRVYGVNSKLGPTSELGFDNIIDQTMKQRGLPYSFFWYSRPFEGKNSIYFNDSPEVIAEKLMDTAYRDWIDTVLAPFTDARGAAGVLELIERINNAME